MSLNRHAISLAIVLAFPLIATSSHAADVVVQPSSGSGFVVKDAAGANERLRVQESGAVSLPSVVAAPAQTQSLCMSASGQLGPCSGGGGSSYTAATGLSLTGTTFSVAPTYRLPQSCTANQVAQWDGTIWTCGTVGGATLPAGTVNQTLRYDASNALVANPSFQAFDEGSLIAQGGGLGPAPATGAGARLMWYSARQAFRAGYVDSTQWDPANVGVSSVAMGINAIAKGGGSAALGYVASAQADYSVAIGQNTTASGKFSAAINGGNASGFAAMALGSATEANGDWSTAIGIGAKTDSAASYAMAIGTYTTADGAHSTAMGNNVTTGGHRGAFIYGDADLKRNTVSNYADNQFQVIASGGVNFYTGIDPVTHDPSVGAGLAAGTSSWTTISDRNAKTAVQPIDGRDVLKKVAALPLNTWQYKTQEAKYRHMGPMAQDFYAAFHLGESDKGIDTVDADGVALAAIQGLNTLLAEKDGQIAALRAEVSAQVKDKDKQIAKLRAELTTRVAALESLAGDLAEMKAAFAASRRTASTETAVALRQPR